MTAIHQLNPSIPILIVEKDGGFTNAQALAWFDYDKEEHLMWLVSLDNGGEVWMLPNPRIRLCANPTFGRTT